MKYIIYIYGFVEVWIDKNFNLWLNNFFILKMERKKKRSGCLVLIFKFNLVIEGKVFEWIKKKGLSSGVDCWLIDFV